MAPPETKGFRCLYTVSSSSSLYHSICFLRPSHRSALCFFVIPTTSVIVPAPSRPRLFTLRPPAPTVRAAAPPLSPAHTHACHADLQHPALSPAWLVPNPHLRPRAAPYAASCLPPNTPSDKFSAVGPACPCGQCPAFRTAPPAYSTRIHRPRRRPARPARTPAGLALPSTSLVVVRRPLPSV
jgi:hypothetical protein